MGRVERPGPRRWPWYHRYTLPRRTATQALEPRTRRIQDPTPYFEQCTMKSSAIITLLVNGTRETIKTWQWISIKLPAKTDQDCSNDGVWWKFLVEILRLHTEVGMSHTAQSRNPGIVLVPCPVGWASGKVGCHPILVSSHRLLVVPRVQVGSIELKVLYKMPSHPSKILTTLPSYHHHHSLESSTVFSCSSFTHVPSSA